MELTRRVLYRKTREIDFRDPDANQRLADQMFKFMASQNGLGLAAPQIGISKRVFVMLVDGRRRSCFNPEIAEHSPIRINFQEGCLSFPGDQCTISRPDWVSVKYHAADGTVITDRLTGLEARCFQHELDHLDGITMWDRLKEQNAKQS